MAGSKYGKFHIHSPIVLSPFSIFYVKANWKLILLGNESRYQSAKWESKLQQFYTSQISKKNSCISNNFSQRSKHVMSVHRCIILLSLMMRMSFRAVLSFLDQNPQKVPQQCRIWEVVLDSLPHVHRACIYGKVDTISACVQLRGYMFLGWNCFLAS